MPPVRQLLEEYRLHGLVCPGRGISTVPTGLLRGAFGPRLPAIPSLLAGSLRLGKWPIRQLASDLLGLTISIGMIARREPQGAAELEVQVAER